MSDEPNQFHAVPKYALPPFKQTLNFPSPGKDSTGNVEITLDAEVQGVAQTPSVGSDQAPNYHFFVSYKFVLSPGTDIWVIDDSHSKGWYVHLYELRTVVIDDNNMPINDAVLVESIPPTTESTLHYAKTSSSSIGGNLGFMGGSPMGGIDASVSIGDSIAFDMPEVTVTNESNRPNVPPGSVIKFNMRESVGHLGGFPTYYFDLDYPARLSREAFQPMVGEYWRVPWRLGEKFRIRVEIGCELAYMRVDSADDKSWTRHYDRLDLFHVLEADYPNNPS